MSIARKSIAILENKAVKFVLYMLGLHQNPLSIGRLIDNGYNIIFDSKSYFIFYKDNVFQRYLWAKCNLKYKLFRLKPSQRG